jgi:hypothetical protein
LRGRHIPVLLVVVAAAGVIVAFYTGLYVRPGYSMPIGWDTSRYLYQAHLAADRGLTGIPEVLPPPGNALLARPGFVMLDLTAAAAFDVSTFKAAAAVPIAAVVALALASAAAFSGPLRLTPGGLVLLALVVGTSGVAIRLMAPETYTDNALALAFAMAALVPLGVVLGRGGGYPAAVGLLVVAGLTHPPTFGLVAVVVGLTALWFARISMNQMRLGASLWTTPMGRLGLVVGGAALLGAATIIGLLAVRPDIPVLSRNELSKKLREDVWLYAFPLTVPLAGAGFHRLHWGRRSAVGDDGARPPSWVVILLGAWGLVVAAGVVLFLMGADSPAHRFLAVLVPLPVLVGLGILGIGRALRVRGGRTIGAAAMVLLLISLGVLGYRALYRTIPRERGVEFLETARVQDVLDTVRYLDDSGAPSSQPVVFVIDDTSTDPLSAVPQMAYTIRAALPAERIDRAYFYLGEAEGYLAGRPTYRDGHEAYNLMTDRLWPAVRQILPQRPVAVLLGSFQPAFGEMASTLPGRMAAPGVLVLDGPTPASPPEHAQNPHAFGNAGEPILLVMGLLALAVVSGTGWVVALLPRGIRLFEAAALVPAMGLAMLIVGGVLADRAGVHGGSAGSLALMGVASLAGMIAGARRLRSPQGSPFLPP